MNLKSLIAEKDLLRKRLLRERSELDASLACKWSEWAQMHFVGSEGFRCCRKIALYAGMDKEVDTRMVFEKARADGKICAFPRIIGKGRMVFLRVDDYEKMVRNRFGILEPEAGSEEIAVEELDLMIVPGVAFDRKGYRLGFGAGYYDRVLGRLKPEALRVGFAYQFQVLDRIPVAEHDQRVNRLVTEKGFIRLSSLSAYDSAEAGCKDLTMDIDKETGR